MLAGCGSHAHHAAHHRYFDTIERVTTDPRELAPAPVLPAPMSAKHLRYPRASCWTRKQVGGPLYEAPQVRARLPRVSPRKLLDRLRARFGDTTVIRSAALGLPPPITRQHYGYFGKGVQPPADALWLYLRSSPSRRVEWEEDLFAGALRDEFCLHRVQPLAGWSDGRRVTGISDAAFPFGQRFPEPSPQVYRRRVGAIANAYGFRVSSLRFLHALQHAPLLVVQAHDRKRFALDAPAILARLDPFGNDQVTFEGFYLEARDADGPFLRVFDAHRGISMGSQWAWDEHYLPYDHG